MDKTINRRRAKKPSSDKLYVCVEFSTMTDAVMLNFYQWCETPSSAFSKKNFSDDPQFFALFGRAPNDLQQLTVLCTH